MKAAFYCSENPENPSHIYGKPFDLQVTRFEDSDEVPEVMYGRKLVEVVHDLPLDELALLCLNKRMADTSVISEDFLVYSIKQSELDRMIERFREEDTNRYYERFPRTQSDD